MPKIKERLINITHELGRTKSFAVIANAAPYLMPNTKSACQKTVNAVLVGPAIHQIGAVLILTGLILAMMGR